MPLCGNAYKISVTGFTFSVIWHASHRARWWRQPPKGEMHFLKRSEVGLFSLGRSPVVRFSPPKAAFILAPIRAPTSPAQRCYITTLGEALNPSGRRQPIPDRTLAAQGRQARRRHQPSRPRKRASTFGNTGKHRPGPDRAIGAFTESL